MTAETSAMRCRRGYLVYAGHPFPSCGRIRDEYQCSDDMKRCDVHPAAQSPAKCREPPEILGGFGVPLTGPKADKRRALFPNSY